MKKSHVIANDAYPFYYSAQSNQGTFIISPGTAIYWSYASCQVYMNNELNPAQDIVYCYDYSNCACFSEDDAVRMLIHLTSQGPELSTTLPGTARALLVTTVEAATSTTTLVSVRTDIDI